jgi:hypothetical protein
MHFGEGLRHHRAVGGQLVDVGGRFVSDDVGL